MDKDKLELYKIALLTSFRREMNGAVAGAMRSGGALDELQSYGVSTPTIKHICRVYRNNHPLALYIYSSKVRELKIAATFIADSSLITFEVLKEWYEGSDNSELLGHVVRVASESQVVGDFFEYLSQDPSDDKSRPVALRVSAGVVKRGGGLDRTVLLRLISNCKVMDINSAVYLLNALNSEHIELFNSLCRDIKELDNGVAKEISAFF